MLLVRTFLAQFFTSETVTSDVQMRQTMIWVLAFVLTPCLLVLSHAYPGIHFLTLRVGRIHPPAATIARFASVRALLADDLLERGVAVLTGYSAVTIGLVTVFVWEALTFDRRDAMVLGPLPLTPARIILSKLAALAVFLLGASTAVNLFNAAVFAIQTSDQLGARALVGHFVGCLTVTMAAAAVVFSTIVAIRGALAVIGGPRVAAAAGSLLQFAFVVGVLALVIAVFASPVPRGDPGVPRTFPRPLTWFVAWFDVIRRSERGAWPETAAMSRRAIALLASTVSAAIAMSILAFHRQMRAALTPSARTGPGGRMRAVRALAALIDGRDRLAGAVSDFVVMTIARNRPQQAPIAINAAIGLALGAAGLVRRGTLTAAALHAAPLMLAFWVSVGLRASFFVPCELPSAWMFLSHAPRRFVSYARGVRAATIVLVAPATAACALAIGRPADAATAALLVVLLADVVVMTIDFVPFTRAYQPGHAKLKTRWPLYVIGAYAFSYVLPLAPVWALAALVVGLEFALTRRADRWTLEPEAEPTAGFETVTVLRLVGDGV